MWLGLIEISRLAFWVKIPQPGDNEALQHTLLHVVALINNGSQIHSLNIRRNGQSMQIAYRTYTFHLFKYDVIKLFRIPFSFTDIFVYISIFLYIFLIFAFSSKKFLLIRLFFDVYFVYICI